MYQIDDYYYKLPKSLISQNPPYKRGSSRLLRMKRKTGKISHHSFGHIGQFLNSSDVLVINDTKVIPAKLSGKKKTGGKVELLLLDFGKHNKRSIKYPRIFKCLIKASKHSPTGTILFFKNSLEAVILKFSNGIYFVEFNSKSLLQKVIYEFGRPPLPPYIKRNNLSYIDKVRYQTVYAKNEGSIAAPTAGLHITKEIMEELKNIGVTIVTITLHVGYGTFLPVRVNDIRDHKIHSEWFSIPYNTANIINKAKKNGHRIIAVGTTSVRTLEFIAQQDKVLQETTGKCDLFIYPGYKFKMIDAIVTNFHLPHSTLLMLVSAFSSINNILDAYKAAVSAKYNFFSYGDAMIID